MKIRIITLEREYGAGGGAIAEKLAARLGWKLWDQLLTEEIARRLDCECSAVEKHEETKDPLYYRLLRSFMRGSFEGSTNAHRVRIVDTECVRDVLKKLVPEIAERGDAVIVGRGSAFLISGRPDAFHVFVYAPFRERVRRLQQSGKPEKVATELAATVDGERADFIKRYFNIDWPGMHRFHLMVNSGAGDDVAADVILEAVARYNRKFE